MGSVHDVIKIKEKTRDFASSDVMFENGTPLKRRTTSTEENKVFFSNGVVKNNKRPIWVRSWRMRDVAYAVFMSYVHLLCLFAPSTFSWGALGLAYVLYLLTGVFGVTLSYHRNLAHRSFKLPKYLEYFFAYLALHSYQGGPIFWVSAHRHHHKVTDTERDPHSPNEGFWFSHIFWLFDCDKIFQKGGNYKNVEDLRSQPYYRFLQKTILLHALLLGTILYTLGGFPFLVWGMGVRTVYSYHVTFVVNSVCHTWGNRAWNTTDLSKNNWFVALLSFGEGWHNNHHAFDYSARQGLDWWQIDMTWYVIKLLECFGLATDIKLPSEMHKQKMSLKNGIDKMKVPCEVKAE